MKNIRENIKMMSVNQISVYHTLVEAYNSMRYSSYVRANSHKMDWYYWKEIFFLRIFSNNDLKVPEKSKLKCFDFTYKGSKLFNMLSLQMRGKKRNTFKIMSKDCMDLEQHSFILINFCIAVVK